MHTQIVASVFDPHSITSAPWFLPYLFGLISGIVVAKKWL